MQLVNIWNLKVFNTFKTLNLQRVLEWKVYLNWNILYVVCMKELGNHSDANVRTSEF